MMGAISMPAASASPYSRKGPARLAALPMYDLPELEEANDSLWRAIAARLKARGVRHVPKRLDRTQSLEAVWNDPDLLLAQTCGYPLIKTLVGQVSLVATPGYRAAGCDGPFHRSAVVVRASEPAVNLADMRGRRCALNDPSSNTGMNLLRAELAPLAKGLPFFGSVMQTGSHAASAAAVAEGEADLAAIDAVTFAHLQRHRPKVTRRLRVLMWTMRSPGLPLITGRLSSAATRRALIESLQEVILDPSLRHERETLLLEHFHVLPEAHYRAIAYLEQIALDQGSAELR